MGFRNYAKRLRCRLTQLVSRTVTAIGCIHLLVCPILLLRITGTYFLQSLLQKSATKTQYTSLCQHLSAIVPVSPHIWKCPDQFSELEPIPHISYTSHRPYIFVFQAHLHIQLKYLGFCPRTNHPLLQYDPRAQNTLHTSHACQSEPVSSLFIACHVEYA